MVSKGVNACRGSERSVHVQVERPKGEWIERTYDYVIASGSLKGKTSQMEVVENFESRPHKAVSFVVKREKVVQVGMSRSCRRCFQVTAEEGCQEGAPKREVEKKRRKMRTAKEKVKYAIAQEVVAGIKENAGVREDAKSTAQRTAGQSVKQSWDCSQIENEEEEEEDNWQKEDQRRTGWKRNGRKMRSGRRFWNEEGWKEALCRRKSCKRFLSWWYRNECHKVKE